MADMHLTQAEADALLAMAKHRSDEERYDFPMGGQSLSIPLRSHDHREHFLLDLHRARVRRWWWRRLWVRVPSWANSVVAIGVRIHALLAEEAKANLVTGVGKREFAAGAKPQKACGEEINDFLVRVPWLIGDRNSGDGFGLVHGQRFDGKRLSC